MQFRAFKSRSITDTSLCFGVFVRPLLLGRAVCFYMGFVIGRTKYNIGFQHLKKRVTTTAKDE